ncbi:hypothetical protein PILCRDRAFT_9049 [Piloderma croceum F 1598]|uniref:Uncharacterized protein n=1 Tax=Piloderma croceum (strain F 1598) TaxID=765440 RepID=A0A0C3B455_PILCF|nr:hypothetical protein PILCRDRAFT_9049 [Piloderma croceum F 1598]
MLTVLVNYLSVQPEVVMKHVPLPIITQLLQSSTLSTYHNFMRQLTFLQPRNQFYEDNERTYRLCAFLNDLSHPVNRKLAMEVVGVVYVP